MNYKESEYLTRKHLDRAAKEVGVAWYQTSLIPGALEFTQMATAHFQGKTAWPDIKINCPPYIGVAITCGRNTFQLGLASTMMEPSHDRNIGRGRNANEGIVKQFCDAFERVT